MPKKKPLYHGDAYLAEKNKEAEKAIKLATIAWSGYLKKTDPLRVELDDLSRRFSNFSKAALKLLDEE